MQDEIDRHNDLQEILQIFNRAALQIGLLPELAPLTSVGCVLGMGVLCSIYSSSSSYDLYVGILWRETLPRLLSLYVGITSGLLHIITLC